MVDSVAFVDKYVLPSPTPISFMVFAIISKKSSGIGATHFATLSECTTVSFHHFLTLVLIPYGPSEPLSIFSRRLDLLSSGSVIKVSLSFAISRLPSGLSIHLSVRSLCSVSSLYFPYAKYPIIAATIR